MRALRLTPGLPGTYRGFLPKCWRCDVWTTRGVWTKAQLCTNCGAYWTVRRLPSWGLVARRWV